VLKICGTLAVLELSMEDAWVVFATVVLQSAKEEMKLSEVTKPAVLKLVASLMSQGSINQQEAVRVRPFAASTVH
jgi:hypothetical protein